MSVQLHLGDCVEVMRGLDENSVDTCITDPPYGLGFMGKEWDTFDKSQFGVAGNEGENDLKVKKSFNVLPRYRKDGLQEFTYKWASEVYRVLKPGALLLAFGGTRTYHRLVCAIEDAGFEIRDTIAWVYGSGFPKSYDISKGIDKQAGAEREVVGKHPQPASEIFNGGKLSKDVDITAPSTPAAQLWDGWGTALKPAHEPIVVAMKPIDGTFVNNALTWGVSGLWIDGGRIGNEEINLHGNNGNVFGGGESEKNYHTIIGRFPANLIHDGSDEVLECFPNDAQRFFYCAKASRSERNAGLEGMEERKVNKLNSYGSQDGYVCPDGAHRVGDKGSASMQNHHPTVKPIELMRYLVRLTKTPTGGVVLDPFMGSGTTGCACALEGRDFIGIEREADYLEIAEKRIKEAQTQPGLEMA